MMIFHHMKKLEIPSFPFSIDESLPPLTPPKATIESARQVMVGTDEEALVDVRKFLIPTDVLYQSEPRLTRTLKGVYLREEVAKRLLRAHKWLNTKGFGIIILDAHRTLDFQTALVNFYSSPDLGEGFVSPVTADEPLVPPHHTGGAVDLTLIENGRRLALGTDYDSFEPEAAPHMLEMRESDPQARYLRRLLSFALKREGFVPHYLEWWHWSYGDQYWAAENDFDKSLYGAINP